MIKHKKGDLVAEEAVKTMMAILGILFLLMLSVKLYGGFTQKSELEQARGILEEIDNAINSLDSGELKSVLITNPAKWFLFVGRNEICFCSKFDDGECSNLKTCKNYDKEIILLGRESKLIIQIQNFFELSIFEENSKIILSEIGKEVLEIKVIKSSEDGPVIIFEPYLDLEPSVINWIYAVDRGEYFELVGGRDKDYAWIEDENSLGRVYPDGFVWWRASVLLDSRTIFQDGVFSPEVKFSFKNDEDELYILSNLRVDYASLKGLSS